MRLTVRAPGLIVQSSVLVLMVAGGCKNVRPRKPKTRLLAEQTAAGARITVKGRLLSFRRGTHTTGGRIVRGGDRARLSVVVEVKRGGKKLKLILDPPRPAMKFRGVRNWATGKKALAALEAEICARGHRVAWRVKSPKGGEVSPWELVYIRPGYGVRTTVSSAKGTAGRKGRNASCEEVLRSALPWKTWQKNKGSRTKLCGQLVKDKTYLAAARCMLRNPGSGFKGADISSQEMRNAVFKALAPDPRWDAQQWNETAIGVTLGRLSAQRVQRLIDETVAHCSRAGVTCAAWRLGGIARAARRFSSRACPSLLNLAAQRLKQPGVGNAKAALVILRQIFRHVDQRQLAAIMRAGLVRVSTPESKLRSPGYRVYSGGTLCTDRELRRAFKSDRAYARCESLARLAGSWLGLHCSPAAVEAALAAAKGAGNTGLDPRTSQVLDGALRVLGWCSPKAFEQAIAKAPDDSPSKSVADSRGKKSLRKIFLHPVKP